MANALRFVEPGHGILQVVIAPENLTGHNKGRCAGNADFPGFFGCRVELGDHLRAVGELENAIDLTRLPSVGEGSPEILLASVANAFGKPEAVGCTHVGGAPSLPRADERHSVCPNRVWCRVGDWHPERQPSCHGPALDIAEHVAHLCRALGKGRDIVPVRAPTFLNGRRRTGISPTTASYRPTVRPV